MRKQYKNILVAVDGSEQSYNAIKEAVGVAKRNQGKLHILTVKDINRYYGLAGRMDLTGTPALDRIAKSILVKSCKLVNYLVNYEVEFETYELAGTPKHLIVKFAKEHDIDLIIIGATGAGFIDKLMLGSTTQYVIIHAPCSVMVVR